MKTTWSASFTSIGLSPIVAISEKIRSIAPAFEAGGQSFAYLQRGELADPTPDFVIAAVERALRSGLTRYPKAGGEPWFKDAVISHLESEHGISGLGREHVLCTYGGQEGLQLVYGLLARGRVLSFGPVWSCVLENIFPFTEQELDTVDLVPSEGRLLIDFDELDRKLASATTLYLNTPHNPTGKVFTYEELARINELCVKHGVWIISDEAYKDVLYDGREHVGMLRFEGDHIIAIYTFSKSFAATGFRIGFTVCRNADLVHRLTLGEYTQTAGVVPFIQRAFADVLHVDERRSWQADLLDSLERRRDLIIEHLAPVLGERLFRPEGAFYLFPDLTGLVPEPPEGVDSSDFVLQRFLDHGIAVVPGPAFGDERFARHVRLSFSAVDEPTLAAGLERMVSEVLSGEMAPVG